MTTIKPHDWGETPVRRILQAFAWGGLASDAQISAWAAMSPETAVAEMLTFDVVNPALSPPGISDDSSLHCGSLEELQDFWSSDDPGNLMAFQQHATQVTVCASAEQETFWNNDHRSALRPELSQRVLNEEPGHVAGPNREVIESRRIDAGHCRSRCPTTPSPTFSKGPGAFGMHPSRTRFGLKTQRPVVIHLRRWEIDRSCFLTPATKSWSRPVKTGSAFCSFPESGSKSRSLGGAPLS